MANITVDIKKKSIEIGSNLVAIGKGGMNPGVYDPQEIKADVFDMDNMVDGIDKHYLTTEQIEEFENKQDALTAGENIDITNNVISATDTTYTAGEGISIDENNVISNTQTSAERGNIQGDIADQADLQCALNDKQDVLTAGENVQIENNVISATDTTYESCDFDIKDLADSCGCKSTWNSKQNALTAGDNVDITNNVISATDTTYTAGDGIVIDENNVICSTSSQAIWGCIQGDICDQTDLQCALDDKQNVLTAGDNIDINNGVISATDTIPNDATITIQRNCQAVGCFTTDQCTSACINIEVPTQASDIGAMPDNIKYGASLSLTMDSSTYCLTMQLKDQDGCNLGTACCVDLPIESMVVDGCYLCDTKEIELILQNGCCICFGVGDLVSGLQTEITCDNKLDADLIDDSSSANKFVTCSEKNCINSAVQPGDLAGYAKCCDIPTDNCQLNNGCGYTTCTGTLVESDLQPYAKSCDLATVATSGKYCDLDGRVTDNCQIANSCGFTTCTGTLVASDIENLAQCCDIPTDNCQLSNSCGYTTCTGTLVESDLCGYQKTCNMVCNLTNADNDHYPTAKAVADAMACAGVGDMLKSVYDPCGCEGDAFNACNMYNMPHIPTDNCELSNSCGFTTCTGTLVESDLACYAKCADIPTNNCQLTNGCGYIKGINCSDVTTALGFTPYNSTNPAGYTTCTGTLVQSDIQNLAQCCDIPTDNCQLANSCNFATCCYVNDSINSVTAYYITKDAAGDQFATYAELSAATTFYSGGVARVPTRNDYTIVLADENYDNATTRYIYNNGWQYQYTVNETPLTQEQLDALNSGITCSKVSCYDGVVSTVSGFGDIVSCDACDFATPSDIPTDNCQLANGCGYTTCTGTLVPSDLNCYAKCIDIPTNNCQLTNGCGYIKGINCSNVITALGYTPYNCTNPSGYTSCTGTITENDIATCSRFGLVKLGDDEYLDPNDAQKPSSEKNRTYVIQNLAKTEQMAVNVPRTDTVPNNCTITFQKNGSCIDSFTVNQNSNKTINITVPTQACDISALPDSTRYGASLYMCMDSCTYELTMQLKDQCGCNLGNACCVDLPLESMVVGGCYDCSTKEIELTLQNGCTIDFSVSDLVSGLQSEITCDNKLSSDLVDDTGNTNKFVTASDICNWNCKADKCELDAKQDTLTSDNAGTDIYITSPDVPSGYKQLSYLGVDGNIDLGIKTTNNTKIEVSWNKGKSGAKYLYYSDSGSSLSTNTTAYITGNWRFGNKSLNMSSSISALKDYVTIQSEAGVTINGTTTAYSSISTFTSTNNLKISSSGDADIVKYKYFKVYESNTLVLNLIPAQRESDSAYGFYDLVNNTFFTDSTLEYDVGSEVKTIISFTNDSGYALDSDVVHLAGAETISGAKTFTSAIDIQVNSDAGLNVKSNSAGGYLYVTRGSGNSAIQSEIKSVSSGGAFGTSSCHNLMLRTNDTTQVTVGTDGSVVLNTDVASNSNNNQVATTKRVNDKGYAQSCNIACINGCCLTNGGDICIQGGGGIDNLPGSPVCICYKWTGDMCAYCALGTYRTDTEYNVYE